MTSACAAKYPSLPIPPNDLSRNLITSASRSEEVIGPNTVTEEVTGT
eukprot:CAMPEP_0184670854 /NCGR_PEP_ID=MMETSP0308-20130426/84187_1 /TAXON_ID=38269 /ORGANISM="Gloeochaete witrockiana, Strain SAG 46.84" /LENGTH=46 /DNA_ID= /DNA_START= /DNA_END= /DNA_ORIENTATION=